MAVSYDLANTILNAARERLADEVPTLLPIKGSILDRTQGWTQQAFNTAYRKLQSLLAGDPKSGFQALKVDTVIPQFYANANTDPSSQQWIDVNGAFDGTNSQTNPKLPADLIEPLEVWERIYSAIAPSDFLEMDKMPRAIPAVTKANWNRSWQWRQDKLFIPGSLVAMDLRIFYMGFLADIADVGNTPWFQQTVPISRCLDALSLFICAEYAAANQDPDAAAGFEARATMAAALIGRRDVQEAGSVRSEAESRARQRAEAEGAEK